MTKHHILAEIRRTAVANGGKPLGRARFESATGIKESDWAGRYWVRWGDALREAGYEPNKLNTATPRDSILAKISALITELDHFPVDGELRIKARSDRTFPSHGAIQRLGNKGQRAALLHEFAVQSGITRVAELCAPFATAPPSPVRSRHTDVQLGDVYLLKSGRHYKIGHSNAAGRRERELAIQLPEKSKRVHTIKTDDPVGIEQYWHRRFSDRRGNGEWFALSAADIAAFCRRKTM